MRPARRGSAFAQEDPWDLPELEDDATGLGRLLREARQWAERRQHG